MLIESVEFVAPHVIPDLNGDHVYKYCTFEHFDENHVVHVDGTFLGCTFRRNDLYWTLFNCVLASDCTFEDCTFRGVSFADCRFVNCLFDRCVFTLDNLGGSCRFESTQWWGSTQRACKGLDLRDRTFTALTPRHHIVSCPMAGSHSGASEGAGPLRTREPRTANRRSLTPRIERVADSAADPGEGGDGREKCQAGEKGQA